MDIKDNKVTFNRVSSNFWPSDKQGEPTLVIHEGTVSICVPSDRLPAAGELGKSVPLFSIAEGSVAKVQSMELMQGPTLYTKTVIVVTKRVVVQKEKTE